MSDEKKTFTLELTSSKPSGKIKDNVSGAEATFSNVGGLIHFLRENAGCLCPSEKTESADTESSEECKAEKKEVAAEEELPKKKKDIVMPDRKRIDEELKKVSNFTDEELSIMGWSSKYKAYSLIMRYGEKGVEDKFREQNWWQKEMKKLAKSKKKDKEDKKLLREQKKEEKRAKKEAKKAEREARKAEKKARKEKKED